MLDELKKLVLEANLALPIYGLVKFTWGNVSGIDRNLGYVVIKPSGVAYNKLKIEDLVVVDLKGNVIEGNLRPSSDTVTHLILYRNYPKLGGIVHTHSTWATIWSQACKSVPPLGTTHADHFYGEVPCTRKLSKEEVEGEYEENTGNVIVETFKDRNINDMPAVLVSCHGPFAWGTDAMEAVHNAVILEEVCNMAYHTVNLNSKIDTIDSYLLDKHFLRKHGINAYYGQNNFN